MECESIGCNHTAICKDYQHGYSCGDCLVDMLSDKGPAEIINIVMGELDELQNAFAVTGNDEMHMKLYGLSIALEEAVDRLVSFTDRPNPESVPQTVPQDDF